LIDEEKATRLGMMTRREMSIPSPSEPCALLVARLRDFKSLISFKENIDLYDGVSGPKYP
jgi:hypothetical protein